jgi:hypothetical protein
MTLAQVYGALSREPVPGQTAPVSVEKYESIIERRRMWVEQELCR